MLQSFFDKHELLQVNAKIFVGDHTIDDMHIELACYQYICRTIIANIDLRSLWVFKSFIYIFANSRSLAK